MDASQFRAAAHSAVEESEYWRGVAWCLVLGDLSELG